MAEAEQRQQVLAEARSWLGTPYHHQGRVKGVGVDCAMILCDIYHQVGLIPWIDPRPYPPDWHFHRDDERYLGWLKQYARPVAQPQPGDVAVWRFGRCFSHGAVVVDDTLVLHAYFKQGVVLARRDETPLADRPVRFYSLWE
ncbi:MULTISPECIES: NlpC/P60 family protein [Leeia]|uniref:NlpC/P60 domain-containing protein n=1 Tax=Leeia aquatica TaxID=2725557 RepID=A0A847S334_9NEIS|nr:NlpC/P60 family protein [Leeia aquatica]NLR74203.1 hypothetical protein [Leeia aquatica]